MNKKTLRKKFLRDLKRGFQLFPHREPIQDLLKTLELGFMENSNRFSKRHGFFKYVAIYEIGV